MSQTQTLLLLRDINRDAVRYLKHSNLIEQSNHDLLKQNLSCLSDFRCSVRQTYRFPVAILLRGPSRSLRHVTLRVVAAPLTSDRYNVSASVETSLSGHRSWSALVIVYVTLTGAGLLSVVFLLEQLDVIFCQRRSAFNVRTSLTQCLAYCSRPPRRRPSAGLIWRIKQRARRLMSTCAPLMVCSGLLDGFVICEFTEVRHRSARAFYFISIKAGKRTTLRLVSQ